jgi:cytochrome P450
MQAKEGFTDDLAAYISGSVLQAGSETTASILVGFVQAMLIRPEVAKAAQEELDRVCGDRFPDLNDVPNLPYIRACAKESLRWMPGFFLGIPHAVTKEDTYQGYRIPKGAIVILNVW